MSTAPADAQASDSSTPPTPSTPPTASAPPDPAGNWELVRQWRRAVRVVKWAGTVAIVLLFLLVVSEALRYYDLFARVHWSLGVLYIAAVIAALGVLVGVPVWRYLRVPAVMQPPDVDLSASRVTADALEHRAAFVVRYCRTLRRNPELADKAAMIDAAVAEGTRYWKQARATADDDDVKPLATQWQAFEHQRVDPILKELDARVDAYIRKEAISVGIGTAVSLNGTLDAFIVLWRNANMVSRISRYYFGRPGLRGSLFIMREVMSAVVVSRAMDDLTDMAGDLAGKMLGHLGGVVAGPVVDGSINAVLTMKLGYLAKRRCRSFQKWTEATVRSVLADVLRRVKSESTGIVTELLSRVGRVGLRAALAAKAAAAAGASAAGAAASYSGKTVWSLVRAMFGTAGDDAAEPV